MVSSPRSGPTEGFVIYADGKMYRGISQYGRHEVGESDVLDDVLSLVMAKLTAGGGSLTFGPGVYIMRQPLKLPDDVNLCGSGPGTKLTCVSSAKCEAVIIAENARNVRVADLTVTTGEAGSAGSGVIFRTCVSSVINEVTAVGFTEYGIRLCDNSALCRIDSCTAAGNLASNVFLDGLRKGPYGDFVPNLVNGCTIYGGGVGIDCRRSIVANITGCIVHQTRQPAYVVRELSNSICITGCRSFQISSEAVRVENSHEFTLTGNIFCWHTGHGVAVSGARWGTISGNEIIDSGSFNPGAPDKAIGFDQLESPPASCDGIRLSDVSGYSVNGNAIFNWGVAPKIAVGIREDRASRDNIITGNNINYYVDDHIRSDGVRTVCTNNIGYAAEPHKTPPQHRWRKPTPEERWPSGALIQSFQPEIIDDLIARMR